MNEFIEEFEVNTENTTNTGKHAYVLSKVDGRYEVAYEIDGLADSVEPEYFNTEEEARKYIEKEMI